MELPMQELLDAAMGEEVKYMAQDQKGLMDADPILPGSGLAEVIARVLSDGSSPQQAEELTDEAGNYRVTLVQHDEGSNGVYVEIDGGKFTYRVSVERIANADELRS